MENKCHSNINKKPYSQPLICEVEVDHAISLNVPSPGEGEQPILPLDDANGMNHAPSPYKSLQAPDYGSDTYQSARSPFD